MTTRFPLLILVLIVLTGCDAAVESSSLQNDLSNSLWLFDSADTPDGTVARVEEGQQAAIEFGSRTDDGRFSVSGYNGCNTFSGFYATSAETITFSNISQTFRYCTEDTGRAEVAFNQVLSEAATFTIEDDRLTIAVASKGVRLHFIRS